MILISLKPDAEPDAIGRTRGPDFAARLQARLPQIHAWATRRSALVESVRGANASVDPRAVAAWLVQQAAGWVPAPYWSVVAHDLNGQLAVLADTGLAPALAPSLWSTTAWVMNHHVEFFSADLATDKRAVPGAVGTALALPLACRSRTTGVLVGLDLAASSTVPSLGRALDAVRTVLEPAAIALDNALALERADALSVTDDLTRLYNSRYLDQVLRREAKRAGRSGRPLSLVFLDLDGFKGVNDQHGHLAGSKALVEAGAVIKGCARETDVVARFGGDEFAVVLPDTGEDGARAVAARMLDRLRSFRFLSQDHLFVHLTASIGVATLPDVAGTAEDLIRAADAAMYRVKAAGKNGIQSAQQDPGPADSSRLRLKE